MSDRFQFLKSYADVIQNVSQADKGLAGELALKIINYGIYGIDEDSGNPMIEALFIQIKIMIDKGLEITGKNKENGKKGGRPKNPNKTETKPNDNPDITKIENRKKKIENNLITLSKDNEKEKSSYGDEEINECLEIIKSYNNGIINGSSQKGRQYSKHLITKLKKIDNVKDGKIKRQDVLRMILEIGKENEYYSVKTTSPELIYYNLSTLMEICRKQFKKQQSQKTFTAL